MSTDAAIDIELSKDPHHGGRGATACARECIKMAPTGTWLDVVSVKERDQNSPDDWVLRHQDLVRLTGLHPFNCEPPLCLCVKQGFICPPQLHYVRNHGAVPVKYEDGASKQKIWDDWRVRVEGLVTKPASVAIADLRALPFRQLPVLLVCSGNRRKELNMVKQTIGVSWGPTAWATTIWGGCHLADLLKLAGVPADPDGTLHVHFRGPTGELPMGDDGSYGTSMPLHKVMDPANDVMVCWEQNGHTLLPDHGFPVRIVIPGYIGGRMIKWLSHIEVAPAESSNFYHFMDNRMLPVGVTPESATAEGWWYKPDYIINELNINSAMATPAHDEVLHVTADAMSESYTVTGYAYCGGGKKVIRAEISLDGGVTWEGGVVSHPETPTKYGRYWCHALWSCDVSVSRLAVATEVCCRAWDAHMNTQPNHLTWNVMGMLNNSIFRVKIHRTYTHGSISALTFEHPTMPGKQPGGWMEAANVAATAERASPLMSSLKRLGSAMGLLSRSVSRIDMTAPISHQAPSLSMNEIARATPPPPQSAKSAAAAVDVVVTLEEVAKHTSKDDAWLAIRGDVYAVPEAYLEEHPGGGDAIMSVVGIDATQAFDEIGHSDNAKKILSKFKIAELPKPPAVFDNVPLVPIACAFAAAAGMFAVHALLVRRMLR